MVIITPRYPPTKLLGGHTGYPLTTSGGELFTYLERRKPTEDHCHLPPREFHFDVSGGWSRRKKQRLEGGGGDCNESEIMR